MKSGDPVKVSYKGGGHRIGVVRSNCVNIDGNWLIEFVDGLEWVPAKMIQLHRYQTVTERVLEEQKKQQGLTD